MSDDIQIVTQYSVECRNCVFRVDGLATESAAEEVARDHVTDNFVHIVEIVEHTLVGRQF